MEDEAKYSVNCPMCQRELMKATCVDTFLECRCGYRFYIFQDRGMWITLPGEEARYEPIARAMRRLVVATGRGSDIPPELYLDEIPEETSATYNGDDIETRLDEALREYCEIAYGQNYLGVQEVDLVFQALENGKDVVIKRKKDSVSVFQLDGLTNVSNTTRNKKYLRHNKQTKQVRKPPANRVTVGNAART